MATPQRVVVFACGDSLRGDDGAAREAVRALPPRSRALAEIHEVGGLTVEQLLAVEPERHIIVVDAVVGVAPGSLVRFDLDTLPSQAAHVAPRSTHELPLDHAVGVAQLLGHRVKGTFLGIGGQQYALGSGLSAPVSLGIAGLRAALTAEIERLHSVRSSH
jgi:hydrogenase maturation protease